MIIPRFYLENVIALYILKLSHTNTAKLWNKLNLWQNTVCSVEKINQALKIVHQHCLLCLRYLESLVQYTMHRV